MCCIHALRCHGLCGFADFLRVDYFKEENDNWKELTRKTRHIKAALSLHLSKGKVTSPLNGKMFPLLTLYSELSNCCWPQSPSTNLIQVLKEMYSQSEKVVHVLLQHHEIRLPETGKNLNLGIPLQFTHKKQNASYIKYMGI